MSPGVLTTLRARVTVVRRCRVVRGECGGVAEQRSEGQSPRQGRLTRISRRRLLQATGGALAVGAGAAALYGGLALIAPPARRVVGPPRGGYPRGQYQIADYGVHVRPDPESAVDVVIPPLWNLVITPTLTQTPGSPEQQRLAAAFQAGDGAHASPPPVGFALMPYDL